MKPKNETIFYLPKTVVITCNDNMSLYMTTQQVKHLFCVFHTEHKKTLRRIFQQSIVNALQLLYSTVLNGKNDLMTDPKRERIQKQTFPE